ncbi:MAG: hypothetical protein RJB66_1136 [Pseudomonadota bacterium]|jgi:hypothetical protein
MGTPMKISLLVGGLLIFAISTPQILFSFVSRMDEQEDLSVRSSLPENPERPLRRIPASVNAAGDDRLLASNPKPSMTSANLSSEIECTFTVSTTGDIASGFRAIPITNGIGQISLEHNMKTYLKIDSKNVSSVRYRCRKEVEWTRFEKSNGSNLFGGFYDDPTCEFRAFKDDSDEIGTSCVPSKIVIKDTSFNCPLLGNVNSMTMLASIETNNHTRQGYYFIFTESPDKAKSYIFFNQKWSEFSSSEPMTLNGYSMTSSFNPFNVQVFNGSDLNSYRNYKVYLGYGLGHSMSEAFDDMKSASRHKLCGTIE